jgi:antitoxin component of MazEF toxin-antitoxin module
MQVKVMTSGGSARVELPLDMLSRAGVALGDRLEVTVKCGQIVLSAAQPTVAVAPSSHLGEKPNRPLSAADLGLALGVDEEVVRQRETAGQLFSVVRSNQGAQARYPAFQAWPEISGRPLHAILEVLKVKERGGGAAYAFFVSRDDYLGHLTPVEVLIGSVTDPRELEPWAGEELCLPGGRRLEAVLKAAEAYAAALEGW